jgi:hypothetical protein
MALGAVAVEVRGSAGTRFGHSRNGHRRMRDTAPSRSRSVSQGERSRKNVRSLLRKSIKGLHPLMRLLRVTQVHSTSPACRQAARRDRRASRSEGNERVGGIIDRNASRRQRSILGRPTGRLLCARNDLDTSSPQPKPRPVSRWRTQRAQS